MRPVDETHIPTDAREADPAGSRATIDQAIGVVMAVHHVGPEAAWAILSEVSQAYDVEVPALAAATVDLVRGLEPADASATVVALRHVMGRSAFSRPVLDGQVHRSLHHERPAAVVDVERLLAAAEARDRAASARDQAAAARDTRPDEAATLAEEQQRARRDREQSALDREWAGRDRDKAAEDRADFLEHLRHPDHD
jgi:hypothetical protein